MSENNTIDASLQEWLTSERWFLRYQGGMMILISLLSIFLGFLNNPNDEPSISIFNVIIIISFVFVGLWIIWTSYDDARVQNMMEEFLEQAPNRPIVLAGLQIVGGIPFILEGFGGQISLLLVGILLLTSAAWGFRRKNMIQQHQN